ncbi:division/cell wall cluster transcriptional repressor MraZ [Novosphingobium sp. FKTRR1]|uniref:division/cell wall cluster transcriptional repressor MraZ n=1 Tax=unclassified Novosphingobium TaxID=2644732 RepID=UPI001CF07E19
MAAVSTRYVGQGFSSRGDKNRFVLPACFRSAVKEASAGQRTLCLDVHHSLPCLVGFGLSRVDSFDDLIARSEAAALAVGEKFDRDTLQNQIYAFETTNFDDSGRFILPEALANHASIGEGIYFNGAGDSFTIWAPEVLFTMPAGWDAAKTKCRAQMADAARSKRK